MAVRKIILITLYKNQTKEPVLVDFTSASGCGWFLHKQCLKASFSTNSETVLSSFDPQL